MDSKYRLDEAVDGAHATFTAKPLEGGTEVLVFEVEAGERRALDPARGLQHQHLAQVLDVIEADGHAFAVVERLQGFTLGQRLAELGKKEPVDAVRSALRLADALSSLHEAGAAHGSIHPRGVYLEPNGRSGPVLGYFPTNDPAFRSPARGTGAAPSEADDTWALTALLYCMLTGSPPPSTGVESEQELEDAGIHDAALRAALVHGLARDEAARTHDVRPLKRELARWFVEHAGEEPIPPGPHSSSPPPFPPSQAPRALSDRANASKAPAAPPKSFLSRVMPLALGGAVLGLGAGWLFNTMRPKPAAVVVKEKAAAAVAPVASENKPIELSDVPVTGASATVAMEDPLSSCVAAYLPKESFAKSPDFAWVCDETDPRAGADKLRVAVVTRAPKNGPTEAMKIFSRIGWYDMAAFAVVRHGCCPDAKPLVLPEPSTGCESMADTLRDVGKDVVAMRSAEESLKKYTAAIHCELNVGRGGLFRKAQRPAGGEDTAFLELVKGVQQP